MKKVSFLLSSILLISYIAAHSQALLSGFSATPIASGWDNPVGAAFTKNGQQLFVWEKAGKVYVCKRDGSGAYIKQSTPALDISDEVGNWGDHGLLGFTFDPNFASNGYIYLLYVVDRHHLLNFGAGSYNSNANEYSSATIGRVTRYTIPDLNASNLIADEGTRLILLGESPSTGIPILLDSHGIGTLAFASDGTLLVSAGDGASYSGPDQGSHSSTYFQQALNDGIIRSAENVGAFRSQILNSHNGKLLRIDPATGDGVSSNPFYSGTSQAERRSPKSRVWALGFRNPFRFAIRPGTGSTNPLAGDIGEIYVGDVGWFTYEELNIIKSPGMNCGWPLYEGHTSIAEYFIINKTNLDEPNPLAGGSCPQYFHFKQLLKQATEDGLTTIYNPCDASKPIGTSNRYFHRRPAIDWNHDPASSQLTRVGIFNDNNADVATIGTPESNVVGTPFSGRCTIAGVWYTGDAFPAGYKNTFFLADFDAQIIKRVTIDYTDVITRVDNFGSGFSELVCIIENPLDGTLVTVETSTNGVKRISYGGNQYPVVKMSSDKTFGPSALDVSFTGNASFDPEGGSLTYAWDFGDGIGSSTSANPTYIFNESSPGAPTKYTVKFTVKDSVNATATDSIVISVNNTPPEVDITSPIKNSNYIVGGDTTYTLSAIVTDTEHDEGQLKYAWQTILRHNNHQHAGVIDTTRNSSVTIGRPGCNGENYYWFIKLTVTDAAGLSTVDSSNLFPACLTIPLPLVLRKFSVTQQGNENLVKWTTESEMNIVYFEVERSTDGFNFLPINQTPARNIPGPNEYNFTDNGFAAGVNYYRLKIVEAGSVIRYSVIVKTFSGIKSEGLVISPNPVTGNFSVSYTAADNGHVILRISDINGRLVNTIHESVNRGQNIIYLQSMPAWKSGTYLISVQQGNDIQHGKLIKAE
jgi:glucose/arabinose dehydrogenase/PKD repeat protein